MASLVDSYALCLAPTLANQAHLDAILGLLSPIQRKFVLSESRLKVARCTRRAGKTFVDAAYLIYECLLNPRTPVLYAGLTRDSAKEAIWDLLVRFLEDLGIPHQAKESTLQILFPNNSKITLFGCDQANARNRLRSRKFKLIIFDETGFFTALDDLVYAVLPMLMDFGGTLCLTSSPGMLLQGLFYEADQGLSKEAWDRYFWSIHDNPHFQAKAKDPRFTTRAEEELDFFLRTQFHGNANHPDYRREFLGEWVRDETALVYPITEKNIWESFTIPKAEHAVSVNLAHPFINTIVVGQYSEYSPYLSIIEHIDLHDKTMDEFAAEIEKVMERYKAYVLVGYIGDYSKDIGLEFRRRYKLPLQPMDRKDTSYHQRVYASDLQRGNIQIKRGLQVIQEHGTIVKDKDGVEIEGQVNHASNACLALHRKVYQTHLSQYEAPLTQEERHIKQLEDQAGKEPEPWYNR